MDGIRRKKVIQWQMTTHVRMLYTNAMHNLLLPRKPDDLPLFQHKQRTLERMSGISLLSDKLADKALVRSTPAYGQATTELALNLRYFLVELTPGDAIDRSRGDGVHGGESEESNRFIDMVRVHGGRECHFRKGFGDPDNGFELSKMA
jgi:hypothetical protein